MANKNDISSFKKLPKNKKIVESAMDKTAASHPQIGRPPKPKDEKESFRVAFSLTQREADILIKKAGSLSPNIFLKNYIRENTDLLVDE